MIRSFEVRSSPETVGELNMSKAKELYDEGRLREAIEQVTSEVKANPTEISLRIFLFELLSFAGDLDRAEKQLDVIGHQSAQAEIGVQVYRNIIKAERDRRRLMSDGLKPFFLTEPPAYVDLHLDAINRIREGNFAEARAILDRAEEERPALIGTLNGSAFEDLRDCDDIFGPVLEVIVQDKYTWIPFEQIKRMEVAPPKQLRDLLWATTSIETTDKSMQAFLPTLYLNSSSHENDQVRLGRMTDWVSVGEEIYRGVGMHLLDVGGDEKAILEVRSITIGETPLVADAGASGD
jgi:type VI secretion system protein ImpE